VSTGSWCYTENLQIKPAEDVLHVLIDIVSKNGVLLLNISPMADGTIPENQRQVLLEIGAWLDKYGESVYETRPWYTYGEGPVKEPEGHFSNHQEFLKIRYSAKDIRYTTKGDVVYATFLGTPEKGTELLLKSFSGNEWENSRELKNVSLLGSDQKLKYEILAEGLKIEMPDVPVDEMAVVFKIEMN
jgi:alpha-L-fucosidase